MSPEAVTQIDQTKLLKFARRSPAYYHGAMIRGFLKAQEVPWEESKDGTVFRWGNGREFRSAPATDTIELVDRGQRVASYDLKGFYVTESKDELHRRFLAYIRRRFGLTLRTIYR